MKWRSPRKKKDYFISISVNCVFKRQVHYEFIQIITFRVRTWTEYYLEVIHYTKSRVSLGPRKNDVYVLRCVICRICVRSSWSFLSCDCCCFVFKTLFFCHIDKVFVSSVTLFFILKLPQGVAIEYNLVPTHSSLRRRNKIKNVDNFQNSDELSVHLWNGTPLTIFHYGKGSVVKTYESEREFFPLYRCHFLQSRDWMIYFFRLQMTRG